MKKKAKRLLALLMCTLMLIGVMVLPVSAASSNGGGSSSSGNDFSMSDISDILNALSYDEYLKQYSGMTGSTEGMTDVVVDIVGDIVTDSSNLTSDGSYSLEVTDEKGNAIPIYFGRDKFILSNEKGKITWKFTVPKAGFYTIEIPYCQTLGGKTTSIERVLSINGETPFAEARSIVLQKVWKYNYTIVDGQETFEQDGNGNDIRPSLSQDHKWVSYTLQDTNGYYTNAFQFYFEAGENTITLESTREPVVLGDIILHPASSIKVPTYQEYINAHGPIDQNIPSASMQILQAEKVTNTSSVTIYPLQDRTSPITMGLTGPQSAKVQKYNVAGGSQWSKVGEWITYEVKITESGYYGIGARFKQDLLSGMYVSRKVYIDDELPYAEAANCRFDYTDEWETTYMNDGNQDLYFYLEAREEPYTIKFEVTLSAMGEQLRKISKTLSNLNNAYLEIIKLTGSNPDDNRTYNFARVMPEVLETMIVESIALKEVYNYLSNTGFKGENTATLEQLYILLNKMGSNEEEIAKNLETFKTQLGSLGTWITTVSAQPLKVDYFTVQPAKSELPKSEGNFFQSLWYELKMFFYSFFTDYNSLGTSSEAGDTKPVEVWLASGRDQAQVIRSLIDNDFTPKTGVSANLKLISAGTLLPSVLAGAGPDVSLMEASTTIIDYALRSAVLPLNQYINADAEAGVDVLSWFPEMAVVPLMLHDSSIAVAGTEQEYSYYALPDKLNFSMMFYREDILARHGLEIPKTWDDILAMIPVLQYYHMEVGIQNDIYTFVYQSGNEIYKNGGMQINFDDKGVLNAFTKLCNMYTQYSLPTVYDFANRFRTGEMPIGIADYTSCNQLALFASELSGLWSFTTLPGYEVTDEEGNVCLDENGNPIINNSAIATVTGCIMLAGCDDGQSAWEFMKWYVGKDCQVSYTNEMVSIQGIAGRHPTPNREAIAEIPWTNTERDAILAQFENLVGVPNYPGSYYLARYINFAFLAAYNDAKDPADSLLSYTTTINKEITRRRIEFGMDYIDPTTGDRVVAKRKG